MGLYALDGKVVLITGAAGGIGRATARVLHARGARVVLADLAQAAVDRVAADLGGDRTLAVAVDVTDRSRLDGVVRTAVERFGGIDVVFANAGIACEPPATIATIPEAVFERIIEVNLLGVWRTVRAALPEVIKRDGYVLITGSVYSFVNGLVNAPYAATKAAVEQFGRALHVELAGHGASAGVLYPGWIDTPIADVGFGGHEIATELMRIGYPGPLRKRITADRVGEAVARGIERRAVRIVVPRRWTPVSLFRGIINPVSDITLARNVEIHRLVGELEREASSR